MKIVDVMVSFKVNALPLPENITLLSVAYSSSTYKADLEERLRDKVWTVVAIRPNPPVRWIRGQEYVEESFVVGVKEKGFVTHYEHVPCTLFLLIREGENPIWWPDKYCEAVGG